ncbi:MAG: T9SS type A sorting domain-containing protein [Bacteroidota bacterium]
MKLLLVILLVISPGAYAQVTLTQTDYPASVIGTDNLKKTTYNSSFPSFAPIAGTAIDMSTVTDSTTDFFAYRIASSSHQYADSNEYHFSSFTYKGNVQTNITTSGLRHYGSNIAPVTYSLFPITTGPTDSLYILAQTSLYSSSQVRLAFPATYNTSWSSTFSADLNYELSVAAYALSHAPGTVRRYTAERDSVIGWGKLRVKDAWGAPGDYLNVLQVRATTITTDSFFLNGSPMPLILLTLLNLQQGVKDTIYEQNFYRPQEVTPLANVVFHDPDNMQPYRATYHTQRLVAVGVDEVTPSAGLAFPNPVTGGSISMLLPGNSVYQYSLISADGSIAATGSVHAANGRASLELPERTRAGIYILNISSSECTRRFIINVVK